MTTTIDWGKLNPTLIWSEILRLESLNELSSKDCEMAIQSLNNEKINIETGVTQKGDYIQHVDWIEDKINMITIMMYAAKDLENRDVPHLNPTPSSNNNIVTSNDAQTWLKMIADGFEEDAIRETWKKRINGGLKGATQVHLTFELKSGGIAFDTYILPFEKDRLKEDKDTWGKICNKIIRLDYPYKP